MSMKRLTALLGIALLFASSLAYADKYTDTIDTFKQAGESRWFFHHSYADSLKDRDGCRLDECQGGPIY